jgi:hypothetical protein
MHCGPGVCMHVPKTGGWSAMAVDDIWLRRSRAIADGAFWEGLREKLAEGRLRCLWWHRGALGLITT